MTRREFGLMVRQALQMLGHSAGKSLRAMDGSGIFSPSPSGAAMNRRQTLEALCRVIIALEAGDQISLAGISSERFADYNPPAKYAKAVGFLKQNNIARGFGKNVFGSGRTLMKRDGIFLVFRLYEQVSAMMMSKRQTGSIGFVDLAKDHPAMESIAVLFKAGAFDLIPGRPSFDGNRFIDLNGLSAMCQGIIDKAGIQCLLEFEASPQARTRPATRIQLARILEKMAGLGKARVSHEPQRVAPYADVPAGSPDVPVLERLHDLGIVLGYAGGNLHPDEQVTWFEAVGTLKALLKAVKFSDAADPIPEKTGDRLLVKQDIEDFAKLIRAKRANIRRILRAAPLIENGPGRVTGGSTL